MSQRTRFRVRRNRLFLDWAGNPFRLPIIAPFFLRYHEATIAFAS